MARHRTAHGDRREGGPSASQLPVWPAAAPRPSDACDPSDGWKSSDASDLLGASDRSDASDGDVSAEARGDVRDLQRLWHESERLVASCRDPAVVMDEDGLVDATCRAARRLAEADGACVIFREGERVHYSREDAVAPLWAGQRFPITNCISGWSILHRERVVIEDIYADERIPAAYYRPTFVKSLAMQPIEPEHPIGAIGVYWSRRHRASPRQLALLEKLAGLAAVVLENGALRRDAEAARTAAETDARRRDEFVAAVSHELRSPLGAILGWAALLREAGCDPELLTSAVEVIERNGRAAAGLVDDLLDTSRILSDKLHLDVDPVDVETLLRAAICAARPAAEAKQIRIEAAIAPDLGAVVGDAERLDQVVANLLSNAIKFTPPRGRVLVSAQRRDQQVVISVADTGIGIPPDFLPYVFERNSQAHVTNGNGRKDGLGLGLAIVRDLVGMHGGVVEAHSDGEGRGATFTFRLPASPPGAASAA